MYAREYLISYEGEWLNRLRDGYGKYVLSSWVFGIFEKVWPDGSSYEGFWKQDAMEGKGKMIHVDGDIYEGEWLQDMAHGKGSYLHHGIGCAFLVLGGGSYNGDWIRDLQHGNGDEEWPNGIKYSVSE